jgi:hypothetical protein
MSEITNWLVVESFANWEVDFANNFSYFGLTARFEKLAKEMKPGDLLFTYVTFSEFGSWQAMVQTRPGAVPAYKRYFDEMSGRSLQDLWTDLGPIGAQAQERLGYPTQKPLALLERIISVSSNEGDLILFLTLNPPTREMEREAASAGIYETGGMKMPRLQYPCLPGCRGAVRCQILEIQNGAPEILKTGAPSGPFGRARTHQIELVEYGFLKVRLPSHRRPVRQWFYLDLLDVLDASSRARRVRPCCCCRALWVLDSSSPRGLHGGPIAKQVAEDFRSVFYAGEDDLRFNGITREEILRHLHQRCWLASFFASRAIGSPV